MPTLPSSSDDNPAVYYRHRPAPNPRATLVLCTASTRAAISTTGRRSRWPPRAYPPTRSTNPPPVAVLALSEADLTAFFTVDTDDRRPFPNATGLEGVFETLVPPFVDSVGADVDRYYEREFGPGGPDTAGPWSDSTKVRAGYLPTDGLLELLTLKAEYIYSRFGKLPGTVLTVHVLMYLQAQDLDRGLYDQKLGSAAYLSTHARHDEVWS